MNVGQIILFRRSEQLHGGNVLPAFEAKARIASISEDCIWLEHIKYSTLYPKPFHKKNGVWLNELGYYIVQPILSAQSTANTPKTRQNSHIREIELV